MIKTVPASNPVGTTSAWGTVYKPAPRVVAVPLGHWEPTHRLQTVTPTSNEHAQHTAPAHTSKNASFTSPTRTATEETLPGSQSSTSPTKNKNNAVSTPSCRSHAEAGTDTTASAPQYPCPGENTQSPPPTSHQTRPFSPAVTFSPRPAQPSPEDFVNKFVASLGFILRVFVSQQKQEVKPIFLSRDKIAPYWLAQSIL